MERQRGEYDYSVVREQIRESIDVVALLEYYGAKISDKNIKYDKVRSSCPIHGGDGDMNFSFDLNSKLFTCFSRHCGEDHQVRDIYLFIKLCEEKRTGRKCSFYRTLEIASELTGIPLTEENLTVSKEIKDKLEADKWVKRQRTINRKVELDVLDDCIVDLFKETYHPYLDTRNFSDELIEVFELGYSEEGIYEDWACCNNDFSGRIIVPIRDDKGRLVGLSGRLATDNKELIKKYKKYKILVDFDKSFVLYNFDRAKESIEETKQVILVEGFFDVLRLWSYGVHNVVAVMGSGLLPEQLKLIIQSCMEVYIFMDGDEAGRSATQRIAEQLTTFSIDSYVMECSNEKDPDGMNDIEFWESYANARKYVRPVKNLIRGNSLTKTRNSLII